MQRVLDPAQIEAFAQRDIPRVRLPERAEVFARRARRLEQLSRSEQPGGGGAIGDYLRLMAIVADAQQAALTALAPVHTGDEVIARARLHRMPIIHAAGLSRDDAWRGVLAQLCQCVLGTPELPAGVRATCRRLDGLPSAQLESQADAVLLGRAAEVDTAEAPFVMAALQAYFVHLASGLAATEVAPLEVAGICPVCGSLPVASIVRIDQAAQGNRYLHCALCATEWHMVRITCSQCEATKDLTYYAIEGGAPAVRAESCASCHSYRKILYQEKDTQVEPVADDLASLALDLLMSAEGYHRASGNPLLWQSP